ncbi:uncharacterized protein LOC107270526 isoform X2 [Cephus cinctus]|uniref:Uncharacterized protein LOC107270526 isoform X2 n=1 Tax=Cephus cinctus TaxID=211228 RepID=A0AAJ7C4J6_CEPCN|nr:uncharacterized protein LOC107270526 isoform X2 [Cephus cinctus]
MNEKCSGATTNQDSSQKSLSRAEAGLHGKLKTRYVKYHPHYLVCGYNLHNTKYANYTDVESIMDLYQEFTFNCDLPKPLLPPAKLPRCVLRDEDPVLELPMAKSLLQNRIDRITDYCEKRKNGLVRFLKKDLKWSRHYGEARATVPKYVADIAELVELDPDLDFQGKYNWYYTGGTMKTLLLGATNVLVFPYANELVATPIVHKESSLLKPDLKHASKYSMDGALYELRHNNHGCILGRYKNQCVIYCISYIDNKVEIFGQHKQSSPIAYISADLNSEYRNQYCTVDLDRCLSLWDINKVNPLSTNVIPQTQVLDDKWSSIHFQQSDPNIIVFVDRCCLHYMDTRTSLEKPQLTLCPKPYLESCENLCLDIPSRNNDQRYIGSYHNLLMCDSRSSKSPVIQKWTHQFQSPPCVGNTFDRDEKEFVVICSQLTDEVSIILNTWVHSDTPHSFSLPYTPPSILQTLAVSQSRGKCLDPIMKSRIEVSNVGCAMGADTEGHISLFLQNSLNDIFYQCITHETQLDIDSEMNIKAYLALELWERVMLSQRKTIKPLLLSDKISMEHVHKELTNKKLRLKYEREVWTLYRSNWKQSVEKLHSYVDILAPELLAVWEIKEEPPSSAVPHQKVLSWLEKAATGKTEDEDSEFTPTPSIFTPSPINTQELISVSQPLDTEYNDDIDLEQEVISLPEKTKSLKKKNTKKKKYISGF